MTIEGILDKHVGIGILKPYPNIKEAMIEFAKYHVEKALKEASEKAKVDIIPMLKVYNINREEILNAYPLENIK